MKLKKLTALIAACTTMATLFVGCGANEITNSSNASTESQKVESEATASTAATEDVVEEFAYPMDGKTITVTGYLSSNVKKTAENKAETDFGKALEEATGIAAEWTHDTGSTDEWFNMMFAEGKYTDVIMYEFDNKYPGGLSAANADNIAIRLNDVIDQHMPNFKAWMEANPDLVAHLVDENGNIYGIPAINEPGATTTNGIIIRQDWLDALKLPMPTTINEWHDTLVAMKDAYGVAPIVAQANQFLKRGAIVNAYVPLCSGNNRFSVNADGEVQYTLATDAYREYLTVMAQWYDEGLFNKDFVTLDDNTIKAMMLNNEVGVTWGLGGSGIQNMMIDAKTANPELNLVAAPTAVKEKGDEVVYNSAGNELAAMRAVITSACEDVEAAARWLDYFWSEEGYMLYNFGEEGVTYTMENGVPTYTDLILNNPDGLTSSEALAKYAGVSASSYTAVTSADYLIGYYSPVPQAADAIATWGATGVGTYTLYGMKLTTEESEKFATVSTELNTYADEMVVKFVIGTEDIDTKWDEYVANCKKFKMDEAIAIQQAAYDRLYK